VSFATESWTLMVTKGQQTYLAVCEVMRRRGATCNVDIGFGNLRPSSLLTTRTAEEASAMCRDESFWLRCRS
jgi:hypothetical protein